MKLFFSLFIFYNLTSNTIWADQYDHPLIFSGVYDEEQLANIKKVLKEKIPETFKLILFENDNPKCIPRKSSMLQLCFDKLDFKLVHQDKYFLKNTISRLIYIETQKAFNTKANK